ncbi:hypothetical protein PtA15_18A243 [Puccinia triticina]|uniref:Uncharacterized protein n=1 Tax=Puccinia triticina TaxID=208348 RepID=A0ABY7DAX7_9BASI|nr:uncharacterized protein PtA15_18A243 [Puccinia triticina]WAQ93185.1 hypothetical protein PtA15_18A243 [Puccinia triticina]
MWGRLEQQLIHSKLFPTCLFKPASTDYAIPHLRPLGTEDSQLLPTPRNAPITLAGTRLEPRQKHIFKKIEPRYFSETGATMSI